MSMLRVEGLYKSFDSLEVLQGVNLTVERGERIALIGRSGCGKSVFLRSLELLEKPDLGRIFIGDDEITAKDAKIDLIRQGMGMVFQGFHLFEHMTVLENITLAPMRLRKISRVVAEQKAVELLRMVGLESKKHAFPDSLSGGQKQRIAICRCLAMEPQVMLFDEPTSALDPTMVGEVLATIRMLAKHDMTMLIVTHEMTFAREVATRVLYFDECGIYEEGTPEEIFDRPQKPKTQAFVRKLKYFSEHVDSREFDLMRLHGGIRMFAERYNLAEKYANRLQLCTEELIYEMLDGCDKDQAIDLNLEIEYAEGSKTVILRCDCAGAPFDPFMAEHGDTEDGDMAHLGLKILKNVAQSINYCYEEGRNVIQIKL
ncbi:MAG: putative amino acid transporter ATP-binding protein [Firmicutes bacterium]|nr:putative amino acid transporter ATP-binding protein [Bacillota bacterium]